MRVGDVLEWLAALLLVAAAAGYGGWRVALIVAAVVLCYFAQCYASHDLPRLRLRRLRGRKAHSAPRQVPDGKGFYGPLRPSGGARPQRKEAGA